MTAINFSYRAHRPTVVARLRERRARLDAELREPAVRQRVAVLRQRMARTVAGGVGAIGGVALLIAGAFSLSTDWPSEPVLSWMLCGGLAATVISYVLAHAAAPLIERRCTARVLAAYETPESALAVLERASASTVAATWAERLERASLTMPLVAVALLGPLTLHGLCFLAGGDAKGFAGWIAMSAVIVGHAHLVLAGLVTRYVSELRSGTLSSHPALRIWGVVTLVSAMPGVLLFGLPPILTGLTGMFLIYPMTRWAEATFRRERLALA